MGSDRAQGFYFARPMLASLIDALVAAGTEESPADLSTVARAARACALPDTGDME